MIPYLIFRKHLKSTVCGNFTFSDKIIHHPPTKVLHESPIFYIIVRREDFFMTTEEIYKTCKLLHATHYLPIACFEKDDTPEHLFCSYAGYGTVFSSMAKKAMKNETVSLVNGRAGLYGVIRVSQNGLMIVTGPFVNRHIDDELLDILLHDYQIAWEEREALKQFLLSLPRHSLNRFLNFLALLHYLFNRKELAVTDYFRNAFPALQSEIGAKHSEEILKEADYSHGTYGFERQLLSYVSAGDVAGIHAFFDSVARSTPMTEGKVADDTLRQSKNIFIGFIALVGKVGAIRGNLDIEQTYQLIDLYTQECERCISVSQVNQLRYSAIMDFTHRVAEQKHPEAYSDEVYKALQFIKTHTNQQIAVPDVLEHVKKSRSTFMEQFKKETGETIGRYIMKAKLQEAKLLLAYSNHSLPAISNFLFFSSQSHFQSLFKKEFGVTPLEYRRKHYKE